MTEPLRAVRPPMFGEQDERPSRWARRALQRVQRGAGAVLGWAVRPARLLPGLGAIGCAVAGSWLLWGLGVALLVAVLGTPGSATTARDAFATGWLVFAGVAAAGAVVAGVVLRPRRVAVARPVVGVVDA